MSKRDTILLLEDMLESIAKIKRYTQGMTYESFLDDEKTIDAVIRNFEIIGEAANRIDPAFKSNKPDIDWHRIRGFRNRIVHNYFGVDYQILWDIIDQYLDDLAHRLELGISND